MGFEYIRKTYNVPAFRGHRVTLLGRPGVITGTRAGHVKVRFDGVKYSLNCHPTWEMVYLGKPEKKD